MDRAISSSPAWAGRAPQQGAAEPVGVTPAPVASTTAWAAEWTGRCQASMTQPVNRNTSLPEARSGGRRSGIGSGRPRRAEGTALRRCSSPRPTEAALSSRGRARAASPSRCHRPVIRPAEARAARAPSMSRPKGTPEGQAVSHPRHCTQVCMERTTSSVTGAPSTCTACMRAMRPRGDSASRPDTT